MSRSVGGPKLSHSDTMDAEAYDMIEVEVPGGDSATPGSATVEAQPGGTGQIKVLMITSSVYDPSLTYTVMEARPSDWKAFSY